MTPIKDSIAQIKLDISNYQNNRLNAPSMKQIRSKIIKIAEENLKKTNSIEVTLNSIDLKAVITLANYAKDKKHSKDYSIIRIFKKCFSFSSESCWNKTIQNIDARIPIKSVTMVSVSEELKVKIEDLTKGFNDLCLEGFIPNKINDLKLNISTLSHKLVALETLAIDTGLKNEIEEKLPSLLKDVESLEEEIKILAKLKVITHLEELIKTAEKKGIDIEESKEAIEEIKTRIEGLEGRTSLTSKNTANQISKEQLNAVGVKRVISSNSLLSGADSSLKCNK